jgi:TetR/AcrR family transcriptional regulator
MAADDKTETETETETKAKAKAKAVPVRAKRKTRAAGRPATGANGVGPEALVEAACELLKTMPPEKISRAAVARQAAADPALINYHFNDRSTLLRAAARTLLDRFQAEVSKPLACLNDPAKRLHSRIEGLLRFQMTYPFFHRLVMEEIIPAKTPDAEALMTDMSVRSVTDYRAIILAGEEAGLMRQIDPTLLYLSVVGIVEQAAIARPLLEAAGHELANAKDYIERYATFIADLLLNGVNRR